MALGTKKPSPATAVKETKATKKAFRVQVYVRAEASSAEEAQKKVFDALYDLPWVQGVRSEAK
jgi:hypothetical protein